MEGIEVRVDPRKRQPVKNNPGIYQRQTTSGETRYVVTYYSEGRQRNRTFPRLEVARKFKASVKTDQARGEFFEASQAPFKDYAADWIETYSGRSRGFRDSTRTDYKSALNHYGYPFFGSKRLCDIQPGDLRRFVDWLCNEEVQGRRLADSTVRNIIAPVRSCLATAVEEGLLRFNPAQTVRLPNRQLADDDDELTDQEVKVLTREQLAAFLDAVKPRHQLFLRFMVETGLRIGETIALEWRHIALDDPQPHVRVRRQLYRGKIGPPKSRHGKRDVPLSATMAAQLSAYRDASPFGANGDAVFPSRVGTPIIASNFRRDVLVPASEKIGAPHATRFHTLRHTCASLLFARGSDVKQVQLWLGHHSPTFTLDRYISLMGDEPGLPLDLDKEVPKLLPKPRLSGVPNASRIAQGVVHGGGGAG